MINILTRMFGSRNERLLKQYAQQVRAINALEPAISALADAALREKTVELKARVVQIRDVERGESVGYGGNWTARRPTRLAIISAGYADGYFRAGSSNDGTRGAEVMVAGKRCPVAGRVSMDLMAVDVTDLERNAVRRGHLATLIGEGITVDELAHHFGTIGYEVLTSLGMRYARVYKGETAES